MIPRRQKMRIAIAIRMPKWLRLLVFGYGALSVRLPTGELMNYTEPHWDLIRDIGPCSGCGSPQYRRPLVAVQAPGHPRMGVCDPCLRKGLRRGLA